MKRLLSFLSAVLFPHLLEVYDCQNCSSTQEGERGQSGPGILGNQIVRDRSILKTMHLCINLLCTLWQKKTMANAPCCPERNLSLIYYVRVCVCVCVCVCVYVLVAQSCLTLCNPMDCSPQDSTVHGISQARILEWVAISFSRGSSQPRD